MITISKATAVLFYIGLILHYSETHSTKRAVTGHTLTTRSPPWQDKHGRRGVRGGRQCEHEKVRANPRNKRGKGAVQVRTPVRVVDACCGVAPRAWR